MQIKRERLLKEIKQLETDDEIGSLLGQYGDDSQGIQSKQFELSDVMQQQEVLLKEINSVARGSVPHPASGRGIYDWLVEKEIAEKGIPIDPKDYNKNMSAVFTHLRYGS